MNRPLFRYIWPVVFTTAAWGLRMVLNPWLGTRVPYVTFYLSVTLSAILGGLIPGLLATILGALAALYFFLPPIHSLAVAAAEHRMMLALDVAVAIALVVFGGPTA
jgi:K+-sensing histidine kinase KdpD